MESVHYANCIHIKLELYLSGNNKMKIIKNNLYLLTILITESFIREIKTGTTQKLEIETDPPLKPWKTAEVR